MPRYIDADAIHYVEIGKGVEIALASDIDKIPTISPDEVRGVGKWERAEYEDNKFWANYCSLCYSYLPYGLEWKPNYCPNCGARMKGGAD